MMYNDLPFTYGKKTAIACAMINLHGMGSHGVPNLATKHSYQNVPVKRTIRPKDFEESTLISTMSVESANYSRIWLFLAMSQSIYASLQSQDEV